MVNLVFDDISPLKDGKVTIVGQSKALTTFASPVVGFTSPSAGVVVEVADSYGNVFKQELNLDAF